MSASSVSTSTPQRVPSDRSRERASFDSPHLLSDAEILDLGLPPEHVELYRRAAYQTSFGVNTWAASLEARTFDTISTPLTWEEANSILAAFYLLLELRQAERAERLASDSTSKPGGIGTVRFDELLDALKPEDRRNILNLAERLDALLKERFGEEGAFMKLNTRSPKDVPIYDYEDPFVQKLVEDEIHKLDRANLRDDHAQTVAFIKATTRALKQTTGRYAVRTLVYSSRVSEDLNKVVQFGERLFYGVHSIPDVADGDDAAATAEAAELPPADGASVVFRRWRDDVVEHPWGELRGFVHSNELNALTQYFSFVTFPEFQDPVFVNRVETEVRRFFNEQCKGRLGGHESYVIDFCVLPKPDGELEILVIELNPFHIGAGAGLFSWREHRDVFMNGPFEFRVLRRGPQDTDSPLDVIPPFWQRFIARTVQGLLGEDGPADNTVESEEGGSLWLLGTLGATLAVGGAVAAFAWSKNWTWRPSFGGISAATSEPSA
jgi:D123